NLIAYNNPGNTAGLAGVLLKATAGTGNSILGNAIYSNGGLGIDLNQDGVTPNDALDPDTGPNDLLNYPVITASIAYAAAPGNITTYFKLDVPAGPYRIEVSNNPSGGDPSGYGEGEVFVASKNITHPGGGALFFNQQYAGAAGDRITATTTFCTDGATCAAFGSTSEFSNANVATTEVKLLSFTAMGRDRAVDLAWTTASELNNLGFNLYRADSAGGPFARITSALVPALRSSPTGQSYAYRDSGLVNGRTYYYQLEDVETTGKTTRHGPVSATTTSQSSTPPPSSSGTTYGDPSGVLLREVERDATHVSL